MYLLLIYPAPDAIQRMHSSSPTESSNTPPASSLRMLKEDDVNSSIGNSPQPNKDRIDRSAPQAAHQEGGDASRGLKRKFRAISQGNGGAVSSSS